MTPFLGVLPVLVLCVCFCLCERIHTCLCVCVDQWHSRQSVPWPLPNLAGLA